MSIIQEQKNQFFEDGYIVVKNLITQDEVETLRRHYQDIVLGHIPDFPQHHISLREVEGRADYGQASPTSEPEPPIAHGPHHDRRDTQVYPKGEEHYADQRQAPIEDPLDAVRKINVPSRHHPTFDAFARHPKVVDIIADLMGPNIKLYYDQVFAKPPYDRANRFHQDSGFWSFFASNFQITCQLLLDDATVANGCIRFIPGSHHFGLIGWDHLPYTLPEDLLAQEVEVPLQAGDATFHHSLTLHCSGPNTTSQRRRGWSLHYVSAETRYIGTPEQSQHLKDSGGLVGPEPINGWPLIRGREFPHCV